MREYRIRYGNFAGSHWIYDHPKEFNEKIPDVGFKRWDQDIDFKSLQSGEWIEAEDGFITQLLKVYYLEDKKAIGKVRYVIKFPMANITCYDRKTKPPRIPRFLAGISFPNMNLVGGLQQLDFKDEQKVMWGELILQGVKPMEAYRVAFNDKSYYTSGQWLTKLVRLMQDPKIRKLIMAYIKRFSNSLKAEFSEDDLKEKIIAHGKSVKAGSTGELAWIKFIHEIYKEEDAKPFGFIGRGKIPQQITTGEQAVDTEFDEVDSPLN